MGNRMGSSPIDRTKFKSKTLLIRMELARFFTFEHILCLQGKMPTWRRCAGRRNPHRTTSTPPVAPPRTPSQNGIFSV